MLIDRAAPMDGQAIMHVAPPPPDFSNVVHMLKIEGDRAVGRVNFIGEPHHHRDAGAGATSGRDRRGRGGFPGMKPPAEAAEGEAKTAAGMR
jgi:hypothetical protein